ncbi:MAG: hypothetical protein IKV97_03335 [Clostridia bacterium]|nr:hypothetical protein [Clostridia bacterium]
MSDISKIDKNFAIETEIQRENLKFTNCDEALFSIHGIYRCGDKYCRLPEEVAKNVNAGVLEHCTHSTGGRVRFVTDSKYVAIKAILGKISRLSHAPLTGTAGFDMYADGIYVGTFRPPYDMNESFESVIDFNSCEKRVITINFPYFSEVKNLYIGLDENAFVGKAPAYKISKPVVFYGSSITHGGCASRPGNLYEETVSRRFDFDYVNLGFSGSARAEDAISEYISGLDMSLFVYDYDHNATSVDYLAQTHEKMFLKIREKNPALPVIMMSAPRYIRDDYFKARAAVIKQTYENAVARGDKNVYFIDGRELMGIVKDNGTVDGVHPSDSGFWNMALRLGEEIEKNHAAIFGK